MTIAVSTPVSDAIAQYEVSRPDHRSGTLDLVVLRELERLLPASLGTSMETGCGKTTILFSRLSDHHTVFTLDDTSVENGSIEYFRNCPAFDPSHTALVLGPTQQTLPAFEFTQPLDLACLDGPHAYPFPELEYYCVYPHLLPGAYLIVDDVHIPTVHRMFEFLSEDTMFELVAIVRTTAVFRRTSASAFDPFGDGWDFQRFNAARFPVGLAEHRETPEISAELHARVAQLEKELGEASAREQWWQHVAEERRLRTRLGRRIDRLRSLFRSTE